MFIFLLVVIRLLESKAPDRYEVNFGQAFSFSVTTSVNFLMLWKPLSIREG